MVNLLTLLIIGMLILAFAVTKDIFSPACIICISYLMSLISGIINSSIVGWDFTISNATFALLITGISIYVFVSLAINILYGPLRKGNKNKNNFGFIKSYERINIDKSVLALFFTFQISTLILYVYYFYKGVGGFNLSSFTSVMNDFRSQTYNSDFEVSLIPSFVNQLVKISKTIALISEYVFIYNIFCDSKNKVKGLRDKILFLNVIMYFPMVILSGGRYYIMMILFSAVFMWGTFYRLMSGKHLSMKTFMKIIAVIVLILIFFTLTRSLVGRISDKGLIEYISSYVGCNIKALDIYMNNNPSVDSVIWGKETFYAYNRILNKLGLQDYYKVYLNFVYYKGYGMGNTYTAFRSQYHDFGWTGVCLLQTLEALIISLLYEKIGMKNRKKLSFGIMVYAVLMPTILMHCYSEVFYNEIVSISFVVFIIFFLALRYLIGFKKVGMLRYRIRRNI